MKCLRVKSNSTIRHFLILSNLNTWRLLDSIFLYIEKERSTSTDFIGAHLKYTKSNNFKSPGKP